MPRKPLPGTTPAAPRRSPDRPLPAAERRLRTVFPELWARYEALADARSAPSMMPATARLRRS